MEGALGPGGVDGGVAPAPTPQASGFPDTSQRLGAQVDVCVAPVELIVNRPAEYAEKVGQTAKGYYIDAPIALGKTALNLGKTVASEAVQFVTDPLGTSIRYGKIAIGLADTVADAVYNYDQTWDSIKETASSLPKTIDDWIVHTPLDKQGQFFGEIGWGIALGRAAEITFTRALSAARWVDNVVPDTRGPAPRGTVRAIGSMDEAAETAILRGQAEELAYVLARTQSNSRRGPVLTMLRDRVTGEVFHAQNLSDISSNLHPLLAARLEQHLAANAGKLNPVWGIPGSHSEVRALNQALLRRESLGIGVKSLDDFALYNVSLWSNRIGSVVPRCGNCSVLTDGVRILSGN